MALLAFAALALAPRAPAAAWQIQRLGGRDYLPLAQLGTFYGMRVVPTDRGASLVGGARRMDFVAGSREARIDGVKHWLSFPVISYAGVYYVSRMDLSKSIDPVMRPQKIPGLVPVRTVVLDPGHGGFDRGAVNATAAEKNYNLDICRRIRPYLQKAGYRVVITRPGDSFVTLEDRPRVAENLSKQDPGTIFVSIHCNDSGQRGSSAAGFEVYTLTPRGAPNSNDSFLTRLSFSGEKGHRMDHASQALATSIQSAMLGRVPRMFDRGVKRARFAVLRRSATPAVLVECGFMSNPFDARNLASRDWRDALAEAVARGISGFVALTRGAGAPKTLAGYRAESPPENDPRLQGYQPLAGIAAAIPWSRAGEPGWRDLLPAPLGEKTPAFQLDLTPRGLAALEAKAESGEDARASNNDQQALTKQREWPDLAPRFPGMGGWRDLLTERGLERGPLSFPAGAPVADDEMGGAL